MTCQHVYENRNEEICSLCGEPTHDINWQKYNIMNKQWLSDNPDAEYGGWMSI